MILLEYIIEVSLVIFVLNFISYTNNSANEFSPKQSHDNSRSLISNKINHHIHQIAAKSNLLQSSREQSYPPNSITIIYYHIYYNHHIQIRHNMINLQFITILTRSNTYNSH